nr:mucin-16 [Misgurnus anguillicaudatus]
MQMTLLSITVWLTHFLKASSFNYNTPTADTQRNYTEAIQITGATTKTNMHTTALSPPVTTTQDNTIITTTTTDLTGEAQTHASSTLNEISTEETVPMHQSQNDFMDTANTTDGDRNTLMFQTDTTVSLKFTPQKDDQNETGRRSSAHNTSYDHEYSSLGSVTQTQTEGIWSTTPDKQPTSEPLNSAQTASWKDWTAESNATTKVYEEHYEMSSTQAAFANSNEESTTQGTTGSDGLMTEHRVQTHREEHFNTTDTTSATPTIDSNFITSQNSDVPMTTILHTLNITETAENHSLTPVNEMKSGGRWTGQSSTEDSGINESTTQYGVTNSTAYIGSENRTLVTLDTPNDTTDINNSSIIAEIVTDINEDSGINESTTQYSVTNSTVYTGSENRTLVTLDTPSDTTDINNSSIIAEVVTDINVTSIKTDTKNRHWPECFDANSKQTLQSKLVCFITLWTLAITATVFLGISIFLWVRISVEKKKMTISGRRQVEKGGPGERESLWADPKTSVQERVEFWYVNGSTLEADRKERGRKREERMKRKKQEQNQNENELWIQPRVTVDDITDFWYANRRIKEERTERH